MEVEKNACQRLTDQVSSLRWDLICPRQLIGLRKRIRLKGILKETVELSEWELNRLLLLRDIILGGRSNADPTNLWLRLHIRIKEKKLIIFPTRRIHIFSYYTFCGLDGCFFSGTSGVVVGQGWFKRFPFLLLQTCTHNVLLGSSHSFR
jgi:hypothetical protein